MPEVLELDPDPRSVAHARRWCREVLHPFGDSDALATVSLLVSELVSNAVLHARTPCRLHLDVDEQRIRVEVHDLDDRLPVAAAGCDPSASSGRGLLIVQALSSDYGVAADVAGGKRVWFEVPAPLRAAHPQPLLDPA
jgi:anti-sigma regulatory factor (Ser/Thr protein kinase)